MYNLRNFKVGTYFPPSDCRLRLGLMRVPNLAEPQGLEAVGLTTARICLLPHRLPEEATRRAKKQSSQTQTADPKMNP